MASLEWNTEFCVGVEKLDEQHRTLFKLVNKLDHATEEQDDVQQVDQALRETIDYLECHFEAEENHLQAIQDPDFDAHHRTHMTFLKETRTFLESARPGEMHQVEQLINYLQSWIINHILAMDTKYAKFAEKIRNR